MDVGSYHIESLIAETPLGALYLGVAHSGGHQVMVYRVRRDRTDGGDPRLPAKLQAQARLLREARVPGLPKLLDVGRLPDQTVYLVWSAMSSESLVSVVAHHVQTNTSADALAVELGQRLARTLARAHAEGVYHLSLTPAQVLVADDPASDERIALLGLGLATLLERTRASDWPDEHGQYAAPEQRTAQAQALGSPGAVDVYALGVLLSQLLGERSDLRTLLAQMCAADPATRPSMADVSAQLQSTQPSAPAASAPAPTKPVPRRASHSGRASSDALTPPALAVEDGGFTQANPLVAAPPRAANVAPPAKPAGSTAPVEPNGNPGDRSGALFGNFRVLRKIGEGGMGVVYEAEHTKIGRRAAVKLLHGQYAESDGFARRFLNEARAVNIVRHPGLVEIFEFGKLPDGTLFYIMEFLEGEALDHRIENRQGPFAEEEAIRIAVQIARALAAAHEKGIVHRDLKPANIMFVPDPVNPGLDWVKLLDFGIAKVRAPRTGAVTVTGTDPDKPGDETGQGMRLGTPLYMAPEQHGGAEDVEGRADVFSLGVVLYELLAGKTPFRSNSLSLLISKPPPIRDLNPRVRPQLADLVRRMMAMEPEGRPTMREVEAQLAALLSTPRRSSRGWLIAGGVGLVCVLLGVIGVLTHLRKSPSPAELRAQAMAVLQGALGNRDVGLQVLAASAIGQSHDLEARGLLRPILTQTTSPAAVREAAVRALSELGDNGIESQLLQMLTEDPTSQGSLTVSVASALAQLQHPRGIEVLHKALTTADEVRRVQAALALLERGDFSGSELLWTRIGRSGAATRTLTSVLGRLALSGDERARDRLTQDFAGLADGEARIYVAYALARLGDAAARVYLRKLALATTPAPISAANPRDDRAGEVSDRLLAARLLVALGDAETGERGALRAWLVQVAADSQQPDARRELALASLGDGGDPTLLPLLGDVLTARGGSPRLAIASAAAILTLLAGEPARLAEQSLSWARSALHGESVSERELAVLALGDLDDPAAIAELGLALQDREARVRRQAALQLARKDLLPALRELRVALADSDMQVRLAGVESMGKLLQALRQRGSASSGQPDTKAETETALRTWLEQSGGGKTELERVLRAGLLFQLGDGRERATLVSALSAKDPLLRKLAIGLLVGAGEERAIEKALADPDRAVRLAAALQLAERGHPQGLLVLRGFVAGGDVDGLLAYATLRRLQQDCPPPPGLATLLSTAELTTRYAVVEVLRDLPPDQALPLLQLASIDRASVVRRRVLAVAADFYRRVRQAGFLELVLALRNDADVIVRAYAAALIREFGRLPAPASGTDATSAAPKAGVSPERGPRAPAEPSPRSDGGMTAPSAQASAPSAQVAGGQLFLDGEELVRVQIDRGPPVLLSDKPIPLTAGRHALRYVGGQQEFTLASGQTLRLRVPVRLSDQLLADGREALGRNDLGRAQENLERLRRLLQRGARGPTPPALQADLAFELARLYEARGQLRESLSEYNRCLAVPAAQRRPELNAALAPMLTRMAGRAGRIQIFTLVGGRCAMTQELLLPPGEQIISIGRGQTRSVFSQIGSTNKLMACE